VPVVLADPAFRVLAQKFGTRLRVEYTYCPLISFQTTLLTPDAKNWIAQADAVFVKGANFFETLQIPEKETFYAFVVYGPVSRACTGLNDFDAVWAHVPAGCVGYRFAEDGSVAKSLLQSVRPN
jgi:hypothetical protein